MSFEYMYLDHEYTERIFSSAGNTLDVSFKVIHRKTTRVWCRLRHSQGGSYAIVIFIVMTRS